MISSIRTRVILRYPWFSALLYVLEPVASTEIQTLGTDGRTLFYNPSYVGRLNMDEKCAVLIHEVMHCALLHHSRRGFREQMRWNVACDYAINSMLTDMGITLPASCLIDEKYRGMTADAIFDLLDGTPTETDCALRDGDAHNDASMRRALVDAVHAALRAGKMSSDQAEMLIGSTSEQIDWRDLLFSHISGPGGDDWTYRRPSRRGAIHDLILPGTSGRRFGTVAVVIDTSGSMTIDDISDAVAEVRALCAEVYDQIFLIECDADVRRTTEIFPGDDMVLKDSVGRGGTDFKPAIDAAYKLGADQIIYFSDLEGDFKRITRGNVIWITTGAAVAPVGRTIKIAKNVPKIGGKK